MKNRFGIYVAAWAVLLALFNVIAFVSPGWIGINKFSAAFWIGYGFITATFLGQIVCAWFALKETNAKKVFYRVSVIRTSYSGLISTFFVGGLCMLLSPLPYWIGILVCSFVLVANVVAVVKAVAAVEEVQRIDDKVRQQTFFIKSLTIDAESLMERAKSIEVKAACKKVYEAARFSDPMSYALSSVESEIAAHFKKLTEAVATDNVETTTEIADTLVTLICERNKKCKSFK